MVGGINVFNKPETTVVKLEIMPSDELTQLQAKVMALVGAYGLPVSEYSHSDQYKPHITIAYTEANTPVPELGISFVLEADKLQLGRDNYVTICEVPLEELTEIIDSESLAQQRPMTLDHPTIASFVDEGKASQQDELGELAAWEKAALRNGPSKALRFETRHINAAQTAAIKAKISNLEWFVPEEIKAVFNAAKQQLLLLH